jgi:hypothetical protein
MSNLKKTIQINPELFKIQSSNKSRTKSNRDKTKKSITELKFFLHLLSTHIEDLNFTIIWHDHLNSNSQFYIERLKNLINNNDLNNFINTEIKSETI